MANDATSEGFLNAQDITISTTSLAPVGFTLKATDMGAKLKFHITSNPIYGKVASFNSTAGSGIYVPFLFPPEKQIVLTGGDTFEYIVTDSKGVESNPAKVSIVYVNRKALPSGYHP